MVYSITYPLVTSDYCFKHKVVQSLAHFNCNWVSSRLFKPSDNSYKEIHGSQFISFITPSYEYQHPTTLNKISYTEQYKMDKAFTDFCRSQKAFSHLHILNLTQVFSSFEFSSNSSALFQPNKNVKLAARISQSFTNCLVNWQKKNSSISLFNSLTKSSSMHIFVVRDSFLF